MANFRGLLMVMLLAACHTTYPFRDKGRETGAPRSSVAGGAGLEPGVPRGALAQDLRNGHLARLL